MLRVGLARSVRDEAPPAYMAIERYAKSARFGIWGTYVLDFDEWNSKAVDKTLGRQPLADRNLLPERTLEFTPPFDDWRHHPSRIDR